jgi:hypothetical protein
MPALRQRFIGHLIASTFSAAVLAVAIGRFAADLVPAVFACLALHGPQGIMLRALFNPDTGRSALRTGDDPVDQLDRPRRADAVIFYLFPTYTAPLWNNRVSKRIGLGPNQKECLRGPKSECADARAAAPMLIASKHS